VKAQYQAANRWLPHKAQDNVHVSSKWDYWRLNYEMFSIFIIEYNFIVGRHMKYCSVA
jgi:hypothetical protein